jgi:UDP-N-acetylglucosamine/UDP-N-acetylgalactosamine diphosphorylase
MGMEAGSSTGQSSKHLSGLAAFNPEASDEEDAFTVAPKLAAFEGATVMALGARQDNDKYAAYADCGK